MGEMQFTGTQEEWEAFVLLNKQNNMAQTLEEAAEKSFNDSEYLIDKPMSNNKQIEHGDLFDIGQTVNGVSTFLWFNNKWYYFKEERFSYLDEYEYDQNDLTNLILDDEFEEATFIKNIFNNEQQ